jgi:hypothetical protein
MPVYLAGVMSNDGPLARVRWIRRKALQAGLKVTDAFIGKKRLK